MREDKSEGSSSNHLNDVNSRLRYWLSSLWSLFSLPWKIYSTVLSFIGNWIQLRRMLPTPEQESIGMKNFFSKLGTCTPPVFIGSFEQALAYSKSQYKFLFVYLHSDLHEGCLSFCRNVLGAQLTSEFLGNNFVFWAGNVAYPEGSRISRVLDAFSYPHVSIWSHSSFAPDQAQTISGYPAYLLKQIHDLDTSEALISHSFQVIGSYSSWITAITSRPSTCEHARNIIEEQDHAYEDSLAADQERQNNLLIQEKQKEEIKKQNQLAEAEQQRTQEASRSKIEQLLGAEPDPAPDVVTVPIRFLDGSVQKRRFLLTDRIQTLYDFCMTKESTPKNFVIVSPYPRKAFVDKHLTLGETEIPCGLLIVEEVFDD
ncbi:FAS-associated factor 2-B-like [Schistocerca gregaria]|uniref:FAS-associated factor 2-B-like n=1 Tax=Schistocerca gregaria TaxID=7010 RepID=UPI00211F0794|nr:FAS-associated factor 2-B-like [Schistocerca gregaria]